MLCVLVAGCATAPPEAQVVSHIERAPPQLIPVPVPCVDRIPEPPTVTIDPKAPVLQRYYQIRAALDDLDRYRAEVEPILARCAAIPTAQGDKP